MKAIDYFHKYEAKIILAADEHEVNLIALDIWKDMSTEVLEIGKARNAKANGTLIAIMKEQNQKWNALSRMFIHETLSGSLKDSPVVVKKGGVTRENDFLKHWCKQLPQLRIELGEFK